MSKRLRALIVEDSEDDALLLVRELRRGGFDPLYEVVESSQDMQAALEKQTWDIVISDYALPQFNGLAALELLKKTGLDLPFIIVSGTIGEETAVSAMRAGAHDYLMKGNLPRLVPAVERELQEAVERRERRRAEKALRESEAHFRSVVETANDAIISIDSQGKTTFWNKGAENIFGYSADEAIGQPLAMIMPEHLRKAHQNQLQHVVSTGTSKLIGKTVELVGLRKDDSKFPLELSLATWKIGEESFFTGVIRDITERKQAEEAINQFGRILETSQNEVYIFDADTLQFIQVNQGARENLGYSMTELRQLTPLDLKPEFTIQAFEDLLEPLRAGAKEKIQFSTVHSRKDNSLYPVEVHLQLSSFDFSPVFVAIVLNITERQRAREALERSEEHFRSLIENALDIITVMESDGTIRYESPSIERVLGYTPEELIGQNIFEFVHPDDLPHVLNTYNERRQISGPAPLVELRFRHKNGSWCMLEVIGNNLLDDPMMAGIVINSRDVTERKQLEEHLRQSQRMEAIGQLAAGIAHDFNNLLLVINGFSELVQLALAPDDPHQESLERVLRSGQRAADLVRQLLAFSRKQIIEPQILNLNTVLVEIDKMLRRIIGEDIDVETIFAADLWPVKVDPAQMEQIIVNLAVNARDAMPRGGRLTIETANVVLDDDYVTQHLEVQPGEYVLLTISDTGCGMSEEVRTHIFEPFFTTKETGKGSGLGLATVFGVVKQSGGHIWVSSEEGTGTIFKIYLPCAVETNPRPARPEVEAKAPIGGETILLVEDDSEVRNLVQQVLREQGYALLEAQDGQQALQFVADHPDPIDLLLTDVIMPGISGAVLAEELALIRPNLKILFMSGYTDDAIMRHGVLDPGFNLLQKPFSPATLGRKVRAVLDG